MEVWKQFRDTVYSVSNMGNIRNDKTHKRLQPVSTRQGYKRITIWHNKLSFTIAVHRMVAETFLAIPIAGTDIVNHIDGNPSNNDLNNLEWVTISANVQHAYNTGLAKRGEDSVSAILSEEEVREIKTALASSTIRSLAKQYNVSDAAISHIRNGDTWSHIMPELNLQLADREKYHKYKLCATDIPNIRTAFILGESDTSIAKRYGVHRASIYNIRNGKNWNNY